jgi:hypothetical protein
MQGSFFIETLVSYLQQLKDAKDPVRPEKLELSILLNKRYRKSMKVFGNTVPQIIR